ncbi:MAG: ATP-binding protein [Thermoguttaceae bacterium]
MPLSPLEWSREVSFASDMKAARSIVDAVLENLGAAGWSSRDIFAVEMALEEGFINAVTHGNKSDPSKKVHYAETLTPDTARFRIRDEGEGFDTKNVPDPTAIENLEVASGRGVHLIRGFMTVIEYNDDGTVLQMEKRRSKE